MFCLHLFELTLPQLITFLWLYQLVQGHGMLLEPVARGSRWRFNRTAKADYNDNQGYCGGYNIQWSINSGLCGICGDDYRIPMARPHEFGGIFGEGIIVRRYVTGQMIRIGVKITANHRGYFLFHLCNLDTNLETEKCFQNNPLVLSTGGFKYKMSRFYSGWYNMTVFLPENLHCNHCVLRWTYVSGNNWGICDDKSSALGCGPQETFVGCADVAIDVI